jgi:hypothetical protein
MVSANVCSFAEHANGMPSLSRAREKIGEAQGDQPSTWAVGLSEVSVHRYFEIPDEPGHVPGTHRGDAATSLLCFIRPEA